MEQFSVGGPAEGAAGATVIETSEATFAADVLEASREVPIIVDFWAPWCGPCKQLTPILEKVVAETGGAVRLVKLNIDEAPQIAQQLRVQSIPAVFAFIDGRPVDGFMGAVPESQVKEFVSRLLTAAKQAAGPSPIDEALEQAKTAFEADDAATAGSIYGQILQQDPGNLAALAGMGRCYLATGQIDAARQLADSLPEEAAGDPDVTAFKSSLELADQAQGAAGEIPELEAKIAADPNDHQSRFDLALAQYGQGANEAAIDTLLEILSRKRDWNENAAREQLVKIFEALGGSHPDTIAGRQKMASILFA